MERSREELPPPPPVIPPNVVPLKVGRGKTTDEPEKQLSPPNRIPMSRKDYGSKGHPINLVTNHFRVTVPRIEESFYQYNVCLYRSK